MTELPKFSAPPDRSTVPRSSTATIVAKVAGLALLAYVLYWIPTFFKAFEVGLYINVMCLALAVMGLNLLTGYTGQISVGHGAFFGIGAYTVAILVADHDWGHLPALGVGVLVSFAVGLVVGVPALRIRGIYLALVTLGLAALFPQFIRRFSDLTGGSQGMRVPRFEAPEGSGLANDQYQYYVILAFVVVAFILVRNLVHSRVGRGLVAIRDNETAAEVMGVRTAVYKIAIFGISAALAGLGGGLQVFKTNFVAAESFNIGLSITILVGAVIGGVATTAGPVVGAYLLVFVPRFIEEGKLPPALGPVFFAAALIGLMMLEPGGIMGIVHRLRAVVLRAWRSARTGGDGSPAGGPGDVGPERLASEAT